MKGRAYLPCTQRQNELNRKCFVMDTIYPLRTLSTLTEAKKQSKAMAIAITNH